MLFILDDLWQRSPNQSGFFEALSGLPDESPESHSASTHSSIIVSETSAKLVFSPRENTGSEARGKCLTSAGMDETMVHDNRCGEHVEKVLEQCGGALLMLSIAGARARGCKGTPVVPLKCTLHSSNVERLTLLQEPFCLIQTNEESLEVS